MPQDILKNVGEGEGEGEGEGRGGGREGEKMKIGKEGQSTLGLQSEREKRHSIP